MSTMSSKSPAASLRAGWVVALSVVALALLPVLAGIRVNLAFEGVIPDPAVGHVSIGGALVAGFSGLFGDDVVAVLVGLMAAWLIVQGRERDGVFAIIAAIGADLIGRIAKAIAAAPRPYLLGDEGYQVAGLPRWVVPVLLGLLLFAAVARPWRPTALLIAACIGVVAASLVLFAVIVPETPGFDGFPSGHAKGSVTIAALALIAAWPGRARIAALIGGAVIVVGIAGSRIYLDAHYPADIVAGWAVALAAVGLTWGIGAAVAPRVERRLAARRGRPSPSAEPGAAPG